MGNDASEKKDQEERIRENGQVTLGGGRKGRIHLLSIIGEIEGHENLSGSTKTTKYEHILPELAKVEERSETIGGDPDPRQHGRRRRELRTGPGGDARLLKQAHGVLRLVIGDSHSIGVPPGPWHRIIRLSCPPGTMLVHPVRMSGMVIGTAQTYDYFEMMDRILSFVSEHSRIDRA